MILPTGKMPVILRIMLRILLNDINLKMSGFRAKILIFSKLHLLRGKWNIDKPYVLMIFPPKQESRSCAHRAPKPNFCFVQ